MSNKDDLAILRHSTSHIMAAAVKKIYPGVKIAIGPSIENGFYYDFEKKEPFTPDDLVKIEEKMQEIIRENPFFVKKEVSRNEAEDLFRRMGESYKVEIVEELKDEKVSLYQTGDFIDLCTGPHLKSAGEIKSFKLLSVAGAYWRGDEKRQMLQRIYGTAFFSKSELDDYLEKLDEAGRRDHRKLGKALDLFSISDEVGAGLVIWHPRLALTRRIVENFWVEEHIKRGYQLIITPHIAKIDLWKTSGHLEFYRENMYSPIIIDEQEYILKPMNCPFHILFYQTKKRSYRELPVRLAEMGTVYRYERSGVLHGMLRVRGFTQDDAHIFCTPEQLKKEMIECVKLAKYLVETFGFRDYQVYLSTRGEKFAGSIEDWNRAEDTLRDALKELGVSFMEDPGEAVFYGPKIDIQIKDCLGRFWQGPTIQFDFNLPVRFGVNYIGIDGKEHSVYMVHRAMFGSFERFFGCLIEHYGGAFPLWLSPVQVEIIPVAERHVLYCRDLEERFLKFNIRAELDSRNEKMGFKIRDAQMQKVPYMVIIGDKELEGKNLSIRARKDGDLGTFTFDDFIARIKKEIEQKV